MQYLLLDKINSPYVVQE